MKKKYFVILNSIIVAKESSLVDVVKLADNIAKSIGFDNQEFLNYQTVYTNIKKIGYFQKHIPVKYLEDMPETNICMTIQEIEF